MNLQLNQKQAINETFLKKTFSKKYYLDSQGKDKLADNGDGENDTSGDDAKSVHSSHKSQASGFAKSKASYAATIPKVKKYLQEYLPEFIDYDKSRDDPSYFELKFSPNPETGKVDKRMEAQTSFPMTCMDHMCHYFDTATETGRQDVMDRKQQVKHGKEFVLSIEYMIRTIQTFHLELTSGVFNPVCGVVVFSPVIPGPCGLYRCVDISHNKTCWYFDIVNAELTDTGLVSGHLHIAEVHILTYAAILSRLLEEYGKSQERERLEQAILAAESDNFGGAGSEYNSDNGEEYVVITQEYQVQVTVISVIFDHMVTINLCI